MVLEKYPDFDPTWTPEVQAKWLEGITKLYEGLARGSVEDDKPRKQATPGQQQSHPETGGVRA
jgi:hypothetical protein